MRILYLSQWFEPEPILKGSGFVQGLRDRAHEVEVVTGFPNYPSGKIYPGYRLALHRTDVVDGVSIHRVLLYVNHDRSSVKRIVNYFSFALSAALFGIFRAKKFDVLYAYPPIPTALAAALICMVRRRPFVMDVQDLWPDSVVTSGMPGTGRMERIISMMCNYCYRRASGIVAQSHGIADRLVERGVPRDKISVIYNWAHENTPSEGSDLSPYQFHGRFNFVYGGNLGQVQGLETLVRAAHRAGKEEPTIQLLLIGNGTERDRLADLVVLLGADNVRIAPGVPREQIDEIFAAADVLTLHLIDDPLFEITIPHKTQSYMAMGRPVLIGVAGEAAKLVIEAGAGIAVKPGDEIAMADAMVRFARMDAGERAEMGRRGLEAYRRDFTFAEAMRSTEAAIARVIGKSGKA